MPVEEPMETGCAGCAVALPDISLKYLGSWWCSFPSGPGRGMCTKVPTAASPAPRMRATVYMARMLERTSRRLCGLARPLAMVSSTPWIPAAHPTRKRAERIAYLEVDME